MKHSFRNRLISFFLVVLVTTFIFVLILSAIALQKPQVVISLIHKLHPTPTPIPVQIKGIGVLGDSQSDEYRGDDARGGVYGETTLNWVELLARYRKLPFGEWGTWEETRREGYAYNWARSGATSYSLLDSGAHTGVAKQVQNGEVNVVIMYIGVNDFAPFMSEDGYQAIYYGNLTDAQIARKINMIVANIKTAIDVVENSGNAKIFLIKIPDWGSHIGVQVAFPDPEQRNRVSKAVENANIQLERIAKEKNIPTIDPNEFIKAISQNGDGVTILVEDTMIQRLILNNDPKNIYLDDGVHTGTVINGLFANYIVASLNKHLGTTISPFSNTEILHYAGIE